MIPKIIHYCWFGGNPLPQLAIKCINSWRKYFPDYEIREWNEENYDVKKNAYIREAYEHKKYAFVSDYARFDILFHYGGIYFDTDVEVIKSFEDILQKGCFMGQEAGRNSLAQIICRIEKSNGSCDIASLGFLVNPGLGMAGEIGMGVYKKVLDLYDKEHFIDENGDCNTTTICTYVTEILLQNGYDSNKNIIQTVNGITIYPSDFFCPINYSTGESKYADNTHSIHWFSESWLNEYERLITKIEKCSGGKGSFEWKFRHLLTLPIRFFNRYKTDGISGIGKAIKKRLIKN